MVNRRVAWWLALGISGVWGQAAWAKPTHFAPDHTPSLTEEQWDSTQIDEGRFMRMGLAHQFKTVFLQTSRHGDYWFYAINPNGVLMETEPFLIKDDLVDFKKSDVPVVTQSGSIGVWIVDSIGMAWTMLSVAMIVFMAVYLTRVALRFFKSPFSRMDAKEANTTFESVAGQAEAKRDLYEVLTLLQSPNTYAGLGVSPPRGVLLDGDPGNGKTLLARAVAGEAKVPFLHVSGSDFLEMFAGLGARRMRSAFRQAAKHRRGCILFIDEIDIVGGRRGLGQGSDVQADREQTLTALLTCLDGIKRRGNVVLIGATNRPDMLDPALVRPGRIDRKIHVPNPTEPERALILQLHTRTVPLAQDVSVDVLAQMTPQASGADLKNLVNEAALYAGRMGKERVDMACFEQARDTMLMGAPRAVHPETQSERRVTAIHEAGHALAALRIPGVDPVYKVSIEPRGRALGMVTMLPAHDRALVSKTKLLGDLVVMLAGRAAEQHVYGADLVTSGAAQDLQQATLLAKTMGGQLGMFEELGFSSVLDLQGQALGAPDRLNQLDRAVEARLHAAFEQALGLVERESTGLLALADALMAQTTLTGPQAKDLLDRYAPKAS